MSTDLGRPEDLAPDAPCILRVSNLLETLKIQIALNPNAPLEVDSIVAATTAIAMDWDLEARRALIETFEDDVAAGPDNFNVDNTHGMHLRESARVRGPGSRRDDDAPEVPIPKGHTVILRMWKAPGRFRVRVRFRTPDLATFWGGVIALMIHTEAMLSVRSERSSRATSLYRGLRKALDDSKFETDAYDPELGVEL